MTNPPHKPDAAEIAATLLDALRHQSDGAMVIGSVESVVLDGEFNLLEVGARVARVLANPTLGTRQKSAS